MLVKANVPLNLALKSSARNSDGSRRRGRPKTTEAENNRSRAQPRSAEERDCCGTRQKSLRLKPKDPSDDGTNATIYPNSSIDPISIGVFLAVLSNFLVSRCNTVSLQSHDDGEVRVAYLFTMMCSNSLI